jgi:hypothetical protein
MTDVYLGKLSSVERSIQRARQDLDDLLRFTEIVARLD